MTAPGFVGSQNPRLSSLRIADPASWLRLMANALRDNDGDVTATAKALKIGRTTLNRWLMEHPDLKAIVQQIRTTALKKKAAP